MEAILFGVSADSFLSIALVWDSYNLAWLCDEYGYDLCGTTLLMLSLFVVLLCCTSRR